MAYKAQKTVQMLLKGSTRIPGNTLLFIWVILCCFSCKQHIKEAVVPYYNTPDFTPVWLDASNDSVRQMHTIGLFTCIDQSGQPVTEKQLEGKITLVNFFFSSCGSICPVMTKNLKKVLNGFHGEPSLQVMSYSVTPWIDSVPRLKNYAEKNELFGKLWFLLTGDKASIYALARRSYFAEEEAGYNKDSSEFLHTEHILLIDGNRHIRGVYNGTVALETERMREDIEGLMKSE